jgi:c-di-GMP-binding flagellar brake protein YcgR
MGTRKTPRIKVELKVSSKVCFGDKQKFVFVKGQQFIAKSLDISATGIKLICQDFLPKGLLVQLSIAGEPFGCEQDLTLRAEVRHCKRYKKIGYVCGLQFRGLSPQLQALIAEFVNRDNNK